MFESGYQAPSGCADWESNQKMLECTHPCEALFLEQHPEFASISEIDLQ